MINGAHFLLYSKDPERDRAFLRDVLQLRSVDAGRGWLSDGAKVVMTNARRRQHGSGMLKTSSNSNAPEPQCFSW